jgi:hypothetical protein
MGLRLGLGCHVTGVHTEQTDTMICLEVYRREFKELITNPGELPHLDKQLEKIMEKYK